MLNNKGFSLVELLATLVIISILTILVFNIISSTSAEGNNQSKENKELQTISYALKIITKDVRQSTGASAVNPQEFTFTSTLDSTHNVTYKFNTTTKTLLRNNTPIAHNVEHFEVNHSNNSITIQIQNSKHESVHTTLHYRKG